MSAIALLNHELLLANRDDLEVVVSSTDGSSLELWDRNTGQCLETFDDDLEAAFVLPHYLQWPASKK